MEKYTYTHIIYIWCRHRYYNASSVFHAWTNDWSCTPELKPVAKFICISNTEWNVSFFRDLAQSNENCQTVYEVTKFIAFARFSKIIDKKKLSIVRTNFVLKMQRITVVKKGLDGECTHTAIDSLSLFSHYLSNKARSGWIHRQCSLFSWIRIVSYIMSPFR